MIQTYSPYRVRLTKYEAFFGCFTIKVMAINKEEAKVKILNKFNSYKDGSMKKEYIRSKIEKGIII